MSHMKNLLISLLGFCSLTSFAGRTEIAAQDNKVTKPGVITIYADWVKNKGKKYDINMTFINEHDKGIIILIKEMRCSKGKRDGEIKHTFFNTGERTIDFGAGQKKQFNLVCVLGEKAEGPYQVRVANVYENASGDGKTMGKVLAKNVEWKVNIAED